MLGLGKEREIYIEHPETRWFFLKSIYIIKIKQMKKLGSFDFKQNCILTQEKKIKTTSFYFTLTAVIDKCLL
jgi:hypothetical protein